MHSKRQFFGILIVILWSVMCCLEINAQNAALDSVQVEVYSGIQMSSEESFLPHYLVRNQFGEVDEDDVFYLGGTLRYDNQLSKNLSVSTDFSFRNDLLSSHYINLFYRGFYLKTGRVKERVGGLDNNIASGSMALSQNARPVPMIAVGFEDYIDVPFTQSYFEVKGSLSHRWLEEDRYISGALLHGKTFYARINLEKEIGLTVASGVVHFAQYGGVSPQGDRQPSSFLDYIKVFTGSGIPNPNGTSQGESNGLGNHIGIVETTIEKRFRNHTLKINYQKPFEDQGSIQYISLTDYLIGMEWTFPEKSCWLSKLYVEWMQTKWQGGPGLPDPTTEISDVAANFGYDFGQRDDTYNNWLYRDGWTYEGLVLGNPFFLTHDRTLNFLAPYPAYQTSIANNRIRSFHLGMEGNISKRLAYRGLFSYTENFGTYAGLYEGRFSWDGIITSPDFEYGFRSGPIQKYMMVELIYDKPFDKVPINLKLQLARDFGDLYKASGVSFSVYYELMND